MSLLRGVLVGAVIVGLQVAAGHVRLEYNKYSFAGNGTLALAVPALLLPLAIVWGWTWVSDRWSGRSGPRLLLYTVGLVAVVASAFAIDYWVYPPEGTALSVATVADLTLVGWLFVLPVVAFAAMLYWAFASGRVSAKFPILALSYFAGLGLALVLPTLTMGAVAGTAAGHSWRSPGARTAIAFLVVLLMLVAIFELPLALGGALPQLAF